MRIDPASHMQPAGTVLPPNDTCELLARRLRSQTQGEVLFDDASRGRYATDASIYQITPVGAFVPTNERDIATASLVENWLEEAEQRAWFLFETGRR